MQAVADQLGEKACSLGVDIHCGASVTALRHHDDKFVVEVKSEERNTKLHAKSVVLATNERIAHQLLASGILETKPAQTLPTLSLRTVACLYYALPSPPPLIEPILILNGEGSSQRNTNNYPINNVCFPSIVQRSYAPEGYELCSVSILENALLEYNGDLESLDADARRQLATWFPGQADAITDTSIWVQKGMHVIQDAQPAHFSEADCANVHGGRDCTMFHGEKLPDGMYVCGDYMATATLNGALESGVNAGEAVGSYIFGQ
jgi:phytoene dehydrogenase-like protein